MDNFVELACPNCASELNYDAEKSKLKCIHCAAVFEIEQRNEIIHEISFDAAPVQAADKSVETLSYKCSKYGKENTSFSNIVFLSVAIAVIIQSIHRHINKSLFIPLPYCLLQFLKTMLQQYLNNG